MSKLTKKQKATQELMADFVQPATAVDAVDKLQEVAKAVSKFNETVECHMRLGIDVKHAEQQIRSTVVLPAGLGKEVRVCVIAKGPKVNEAKEAGADFYGTEDIIDKISGGWFEFDTLIATPDCMGMLGKLGRVLGPNTRPNLPNIPIQTGVAISVSKSNQPPSIFSIISSAPAKSAPASFASVALAPFAITQTLTSLPRPAGNTTVDLICWSA